MKKAVDLFEELYDISCYVKKSYMEEELSEEISQGLVVICCAASYVFDKCFAKEKAGEELTSAAMEAYQGAHFPMSDLPRQAKEILDDMENGAFFKGKSAFREYLNQIHEADSGIEEACKDDEGIFILSTCDKIAELLNKSSGEDIIMKTCEFVFLNIASIIMDYFKLLYGPLLKKKASAAYFLQLQDKFQLIREENQI